MAVERLEAFNISEGTGDITLSMVISGSSKLRVQLTPTDHSYDPSTALSPCMGVECNVRNLFIRAWCSRSILPSGRLGVLRAPMGVRLKFLCPKDTISSRRSLGMGS